MPRRSKKDALLDFEISFYQKLLRAHPDYVDALIPLGEAYTRRGLYDQGLQIDLALTRLCQNNPTVWYNLACSYSLLNRLELSLEALRKSMALGYRDVEHLQRDPDLFNLRRAPQFRELLQSLQQPEVTS